MHGRVQTWYPFNIQIYLNGKEWLGKMMTTEGLTFVKNDNCFTWVNDFEKAATILKKQTQECWPKTLDVIMEIINPISYQICNYSAVYLHSTTNFPLNPP